MGRDTPNSVRIRCDDGNEHRYQSIQMAANFYDCNRSDAVSHACTDVPALVEAVQDILEREDLTHQQRTEIADRVNRAATGIRFSVDVDIQLTK